MSEFRKVTDDRWVRPDAIAMIEARSSWDLSWSVDVLLTSGGWVELDGGTCPRPEDCEREARASAAALAAALTDTPEEPA